MAATVTCDRAAEDSAANVEAGREIQRGECLADANADGDDVVSLKDEDSYNKDALEAMWEMGVEDADWDLATRGQFFSVVLHDQRG